MLGWFKRNKEQEFEQFVRAAARGEHRKKLRAALQYIGVTIEAEQDRTRYCIETTAAFVRAVMRARGIDFDRVSDNDIFASGIFLFVFANHLTRLLDTEFEPVATVAPMELYWEAKTPEELSKYINPIINTYNNASKTSAFPQILGQTFANFIEEPSEETFVNLTKLYDLCVSHLK